MTVHATPWWLCPNDPRCPHGAIFHDINEYGDPSPTCCVEGCNCGKAARALRALGDALTEAGFTHPLPTSGAVVSGVSVPRPETDAP